MALAFQRQDIRTPKIFAVDFANGFLLEDFGNRLLQPELTGDNSPAAVAERYSQAEQTLMAIQAVTPQSAIFPPYDADNLQTGDEPVCAMVCRTVAGN